MMTSKLCVVAMAETLADLRRQRDAAAEVAGLVELRLDALTQVDVAGALQGRTTPVIATCRAAWEGGRFQGSEQERHAILSRALELGAEYVDVEWKAGFTDLLKPETAARLVLSMHDFQGVPTDLTSLATAMRATGAGVVKLAVTPRRLTDCLRVFDAARAIDAAGRAVFIAMGEFGVVSRVAAAQFGSPWTYAGSVPGIGQLDPATLKGTYHFDRITASTALYGITGLPVSHSVSPAMHNAAFRAAGLDAVYLPYPAVDAEDFMAFARGIGLAGASVTIPYKVDLTHMVDEVDSVARQVGALNTVRCRDGRWEAMNSDIEGFVRPLRERGLALDKTRASVLGAGGSARAVVSALASAGARVTVSARNASRAQALADACDVDAGRFPPAPGSWDLLVNCTPVGMYPDTGVSPMGNEALTGRTVYDLIYNPLETRLLRDAVDAGCTTIGGLEMLVAQAQRQFEWWTDVRPPADVMRAAALARLAEFRAHEDHLV